MDFTLPDAPPPAQPEVARKVIRRVLTGEQVLSQRPERLAMIDKRHVIDAAEAIEERERQSMTAHALTDVVTRNDRARVELDESQIAAKNMLLTEQYAVIGGYAGSGKTTLVEYALDDIADQVTKIDWTEYRSVGKEHSGTARNPAIGLFCFANVAARNLASKLSEKWAVHCMSIHAGLAFAPVDYDEFNRESQRFEPRYNSTNSLKLDVIIIDEAGMVPRELWHQILAACLPHTRIYFLGDLAQLPALTGASPMPFAVLHWPTIILDKIYRQKEGSALLDNLTRIRRGIEPVHDAQVFRCGEKEILPSSPTEAKKYIASYISTLYKMKLWDPAQDIIITSQNDAPLGQMQWNTAFRYAFNPERKDENGVSLNPPILMRTALGVITLSVGDKVMATDNGGRTSMEKRFINGSIGTITKIEPNKDYQGDMTGLGALNYAIDAGAEDRAQSMFEFVGEQMEELSDTYAGESAVEIVIEEDIKRRQASHVVTVVEAATGEEYILTRSAEIASLHHAYAATCHKFQGSQARNVMVICHRNMPFGLNREWLYTACSRAKERVFLLHEKLALSKSIEKQLILGRNPKEKAEYLVKLYANRQFAIPRLPDARRLKG